MSILDDYLKFTSGMEPREQLHRWSFISATSSALARNVYLPFGSNIIYPWQYIVIVGNPGSRKSTAISLARDLLKASGYGTFAFAKSSKQKFLQDFSLGFDAIRPDGKADFEKLLDKKLDAAQEAFICAGEFIDFIGVKNTDFISLLTNLWDPHDVYDERFKTTESTSVRAPTINMLGGITPVNMQLALPTEVIGHGFLSRVIMVYGELASKRITWPRVPTDAEKKPFIDFFREVRKLSGQITFTPDAMHMVDEIYQNWEMLEDVRLQYYCGRRLDHLLKLCIVMAAMDLQIMVSTDHVMAANTILSYTEASMEKALGEFGKSRNAEAMSKILDALANKNGPMNMDELYKVIARDVERPQDLYNIMVALEKSGKIIVNAGHVTARPSKVRRNDMHVDYRKYIIEYGTDNGGTK